MCCISNDIILLLSLSYYYGLQEAKQLLEQGQQQRLDVKETLLETIAVLGQRTHSPSAQLLALAVLVGRLDDLDPGIRSFAAQLLLGKCAVYTSGLWLPSCYWVSVLFHVRSWKGICLKLLAAGRQCNADNSLVLQSMYSPRMHGKCLPYTITIW